MPIGGFFSFHKAKLIGFKFFIEQMSFYKSLVETKRISNKIVVKYKQCFGIFIAVWIIDARQDE